MQRARALAVIAHEIPQEVGDIMVLRHHGWALPRAVGYNALASLATIPGALLAWGIGKEVVGVAPYALSISAASFLYIALADLTPDHRAQSSLRVTLVQVLGIVAGVGTIVLVHAVSRMPH
ncbi:MAG TPA: ZIP family metal transporter [Opitutaceae bacterium]